MRKSTSTQSFAGSSANCRGQGLSWSFPSGATRYVVVFVAVLLAGCGSDEIQHYRARRIQTSEPEPQRLLGAIIPHDAVTWFFKLTGPPEVIAAEKERFDAFLQTIRFDRGEQEPIAWTTPEGWHQHPGEGMRYATFHVGGGDHSIELSVTQFPGKSGGLLANVNRWRGQLGLGKISEEELLEVTAQVEINGVTATVIDFEGTSGSGSGSSTMAPFAGLGGPTQSGATSGATMPRGSATPSLSYTIPEGWVEDAAGGGGFRAATLRVTQGDKQAEITVIPLGAQSGSLLENVNRWRSQIDLGPVEETGLKQLVRSIPVGEAQAVYVTIIGPESAGNKRQGMLAAVLPHDGRTWYFKMLGPAELVENQKSAFESFLSSVRFAEAGDEGAGDG